MLELWIGSSSILYAIQLEEICQNFTSTVFYANLTIQNLCFDLYLINSDNSQTSTLGMCGRPSELSAPKAKKLCQILQRFSFSLSPK